VKALISRREGSRFEAKMLGSRNGDDLFEASRGGQLRIFLRRPEKQRRLEDVGMTENGGFSVFLSVFERMDW